MNPPKMRLQENGTAIRPTSLDDLAELVALRNDNRAHTGPWEPSRDDAFYTPAGQRIELDLDAQAWAVGSAYPFSILDAGSEDRLVGRVALANIVRGAWQNATLGYWIAHAAAGRGHATRAVALALRFAFEHARLHRVQPAVIPRNLASIRVVERNGFRREGHAERYLQINGVWEDHTLFALTAEEWRARNGG
jgi:ribosomal-protein-alanine N-acetyltransferase